MFAFYSKFGLKHRKERMCFGEFSVWSCALFVHVSGCPVGGLCVICVNVYGRRSGGLALVLGDCLLPGDPRVLALLCCLYFERSLNFIFHDIHWVLSKHIKPLITEVILEIAITFWSFGP